MGMQEVVFLQYFLFSQTSSRILLKHIKSPLLLKVPLYIPDRYLFSGLYLLNVCTLYISVFFTPVIFNSTFLMRDKKRWCFEEGISANNFFKNYSLKHLEDSFTQAISLSHVSFWQVSLPAGLHVGPTSYFFALVCIYLQCKKLIHQGSSYILGKVIT